MDEILCKKCWTGAEGVKNDLKMVQNPLKKFKSPILIEILEIPENHYIFTYFSALKLPINRTGGLYVN